MNEPRGVGPSLGQRRPISATRRLRRIAAAIAAVVISMALGALVFFRVQWSPSVVLIPRFPLGPWVASLPVHLPWVTPFALLIAGQPLLRAFVWRAVLPSPRPPLSACYHALALGGLVHNILPGKLGPAGSAWVLRRLTAEGSTFTALLASLLLVKLAELAALIVLASLMVVVIETWFGGAGLLGRVVVGGLVLLAVFAAAAFSAAHAAPRIATWLETRGWRRTAHFVTALAGGLAALRSAPHVGVIGLTAFAPVTAGALAFGLAVATVDARGGVLGGALVLAAITMGGITPGLPVGMGVYYFVASWAARQLGAPDADAAAVAALSHAANVVVGLTLGVASAVMQRRSARAILRFRRSNFSALASDEAGTLDRPRRVDATSRTAP